MNAEVVVLTSRFYTVDERTFNMNLVLSVILIFGYQNYVVKGYEVVQYITSKMHEFSNTVSTAFNTLMDKITFSKPEVESVNQYVLRTGCISADTKTKTTFSDFVAEEAAKIETEFPVLSRLKTDPMALMSTPQLAIIHGKRLESHVVKTDDGYLLTLHRLRNPMSLKSEPHSILRNLTVLIHHGLLGSSADWILLGPEKSLPYILSDAGCDVWLTNARGNYYSRRHTSFGIDSLEFWKFSFEEMGIYDLPAVVKYITKNRIKNGKINFIGHSMGATAFLVMLSVKPSYNEYFRIGILLAPLAFMNKVEGPLKLLTSATRSRQQDMLKLLDDSEFIPSRIMPAGIANKYCKSSDLCCNNPLLLLSGSLPEKNTWDDSFTARVWYHVPAGGSTNTINHYIQILKSGKFKSFNNKNYEFDLKHVTVPIVLFSSDDDKLATKVGVLKLYFSIANPIEHFVINDAKLTHMDFVWHHEADSLVFIKVVQSLELNLSLNQSSLSDEIIGM